MPRAKSEDGAPVAAATRPEGISEEAWDIGRELGNVSLAVGLLQVIDGERAPSDASEATALLESATKLQSKALKRHVKMRQTVGRKLSDSQSKYHAYTRFVSRMLKVQDNPQALMNGPSST